MRKVDLFWQSNDAWWELQNHVPVLKETAPPDAKESYKRYLEQTNVYHYRKDSRITGEYDPPMSEINLHPSEEDVQHYLFLLKKYGDDPNSDENKAVIQKMRERLRETN